MPSEGTAPPATVSEEQGAPRAGPAEAGRNVEGIPGSRGPAEAQGCTNGNVQSTMLQLVSCVVFPTYHTCILQPPKTPRPPRPNDPRPPGPTPRPPHDPTPRPTTEPGASINPINPWAVRPKSGTSTHSLGKPRYREPQRPTASSCDTVGARSTSQPCSLAPRSAV